MTRPVMFLRTAQTESRIEDLEKKMEQVMERLGMMEPPQQPWKPGDSLAAPVDDEWEKAAPPPPPKQSKIAQKVAKR